MYLRKASIKLIEKLIIEYPIPQPEILKTLHSLQIELSLTQTKYHIKGAIIQFMNKVLEQYDLPET